MRQEEWNKIKACWERLVVELDLDNGIVDRLYSKGVLTDLDKNRISVEKINQEKNKIFLDILQTKDDEAYAHFKDALNSFQPALAELLQSPERLHKKGQRKGQGLLIFKIFIDCKIVIATHSNLSCKKNLFEG